MGLHLIILALAMPSPTEFLGIVGKILAVGLGLGMVIFVHELGHFGVAKWCGVKCEKFYLGFDVGGKKLFHFQWGETEYGIGILPLGGYVKMLGQEDNPARLQEEIERARIRKTTEGADSSGEPEYTLDPRSYLAKSVPARMAIISAGVIMNVIFAFFVAMGAYAWGVHIQPVTVSTVVPGLPAYVAGVQVGDQITEIGGRPVREFRDLQQGIVLGNYGEDGLKVKLNRPDSAAPEGVRMVELQIVPNQKGELPLIGITPSMDTVLRKDLPVQKYSPADKTTSGFKGGDRIIAINDEPVPEHDYTRLAWALSKSDLSKWISVKVARDDKPEGAITIQVPARPMRTLGLVMAMGGVSSVQVGSPAEQAGILEGDLIVGIDGQLPGDPLTLPQRLQTLAAAGKEIEIDVQRGNEKKKLSIRLADRRLLPTAPADSPVEVPTLGLTYQVFNRIAAVEAGSPAYAAHQEKPLEGEIISAEIISADDEKAQDDKKVFPITTLKFGKPEGQEYDLHWPFFFDVLQGVAPDTKIKLTLKGGREVTLVPTDSKEFFQVDRGLNLTSLQVVWKAQSLGECVELATRETVGSLTMVLSFLEKLVKGKLSPKLMGGPIKIFGAGWGSISMGPGDFLLFLGLLSANLAVVNLLPIPVLDGGHLMFLTYEFGRGKPASDRVATYLQTVGLLFIVCLILFVFFQDGRWLFKIMQS